MATDAELKAKNDEIDNLKAAIAAKDVEIDNDKALIAQLQSQVGSGNVSSVELTFVEALKALIKSVVGR